MTQTAEYLCWLQQRNGKVTLREIMQTHFACEYRKHHSLLRQDGYKIECLRAKKASDNLYVLEEPRTFDETGQGRLI